MLASGEELAAPKLRAPRVLDHELRRELFPDRAARERPLARFESVADRLRAGHDRDDLDDVASPDGPTTQILCLDQRGRSEQRESENDEELSHCLVLSYATSNVAVISVSFCIITPQEDKVKGPQCRKKGLQWGSNAAV